MVTGVDASTSSFEEMLSSELILVLGSDLMMNSTVVGIKIREAVKLGAKLVVINNKETILDEIADITLIEDTTETLKEIEEIIAASANGKEMPADKSEIALEIANLYLKAKTPMIVYNQNEASLETAKIAANIAAMTKNIGKARAGVIQLKANANSQGIVDLGISTDKADFYEKLAKGTIKAVASFGEDVNLDAYQLDLLVVQDVQMSELAKKAHVVLPGASFAESAGTFTSSERRIQKIQKVLQHQDAIENWEIAMEIARVLEPNFGFRRSIEIQEEISRSVAGYHGLSKMQDHMVWPYQAAKCEIVETTEAPLVDEQENTSNAINHFAAYIKKTKAM